MKLSTEEVERFLAFMKSLHGKRISVYQSLCAARHTRHDPQFTTVARFSMRVNYLGGSKNGSELRFEEDQNTYFAIAMEAITHFEIKDTPYVKWQM